jgi:hypothetical protein
MYHKSSHMTFPAYIYIDCYLPIKAYDYVPIYNNDIEHTKPHNHIRQD